MLTAGIIAEYNPLHNGHLYHIEKTKELYGADRIVVVMSSTFTQRSEPAVISKWARAKSAILSGVDLVIELPLPYATASAEIFAYNAVKILDSLGVVDILSFGSESGDIKQLEFAADILNCEEYRSLLKSELVKGLPFAAARRNAVKALCGEDAGILFDSPNNILAIEYIKALQRINSQITPVTVKRTGTGYHDMGVNGKYVSATYCRKLIEDNDPALKDVLPEQSFKILMDEINAGSSIVNPDVMDLSMMTKLRMLKQEDFCEISDTGEGLWRRVYNSIKEGCSCNEITAIAKTKRYTLSRIRRILLRAFLDVKKHHVEKQVPYIRILAFNDNGRDLLRRADQNRCLPIITKPSTSKKLDREAFGIFMLEVAATDVWNVHCPNVKKCGLDFTTNPVYIRDNNH